MASKFLNISTDTTLGGNSPSDEIVSSQKAIKTALDAKVINNSTITIKQGGTTKGSFTLNQATDSTIELDAGGGGGGSYTAGDGIDITSDVISVSNLDCGTMA